MPSAAFLRMPCGRFSLKKVRTSSRNAFSSGVKRRSMRFLLRARLFVLVRGAMLLTRVVIATQLRITLRLVGRKDVECRKMVFQMRVSQSGLRFADLRSRASERCGCAQLLCELAIQLPFLRDEFLPKWHGLGPHAGKQRLNARALVLSESKLVGELQDMH